MLDMDSKFEYILDLCDSLNADYLNSLIKRLQTMVNYKECEEDE